MAAAPAPQTLNDIVELARKHIAGELETTPATAPVETGQEPSPAPTPTEPAQPSPDATPAAEPAIETGEPTADEMATWTEGEKRLHGALVKERTESKDARAKLRDAMARLDALESKTPPAAPQAEPPVPAAQNPTVPATGDILADCKTFEEVDARVMQAATFKSQASALQNMLLRNGVEPVAERLKASGVEKIGTTPIAEASADQIGDFLAAVYEASEMSQAQAPIRKNWLVQNHQSLQDAVKHLPELNDKTSAAYQAAVRMVQENPLLRNRSDWPMLIVKNLLGTRALENLAKPPAPAPAAPAAPRPAPKPAPGAPRTSVSALPQPAANDALKKKMANGTATMQEVTEYARGHIAVA